MDGEARHGLSVLTFRCCQSESLRNVSRRTTVCLASYQRPLKPVFQGMASSLTVFSVVVGKSQSRGVKQCQGLSPTELRRTVGQHTSFPRRNTRGRKTTSTMPLQDQSFLLCLFLVFKSFLSSCISLLQFFCALLYSVDHSAIASTTPTTAIPNFFHMSTTKGAASQEVHLLPLTDEGAPDVPGEYIYLPPPTEPAYHVRFEIEGTSSICRQGSLWVNIPAPGETFRRDQYQEYKWVP